MQRSIDIHKQKLQMILEKLDGENLVTTLDKCEFACRQVKWLAYTRNSEGTKRVIRKTEANEKLSPLKTTRVFTGFIHHLTGYNPNLAQKAAALQPLQKNTEKNKPILWKPEHNTSFKNIIRIVSEITQNKLFDQHLETRIVCVASNSGLGASLEQHSKVGWMAIAYASRFLNSLEEKYSTNELNFLDVVWAIKNFKYYFYGKHLTVITDH